MNKTALAWLIVPNRGMRLVKDVPVSKQIEVKNIKINLFRWRSKWYATEDSKGLKVGSYMPTRTRRSLEDEIYKRYRKVDPKKLKQNIAADYKTEAALQIGNVIPFDSIK